MKNRLAGERSPYLRAHAEDAIGWYPWGPEALARAKAEDKPIFLSLGFSACHWCHVIHSESFGDPEIAGLLNGCYLPVKVDRQERPDLDAIMMAFCVGMTGGGGWPLTAILTPDGMPFFTGTYFPPRSTARMPGLLEILEEIARRWPVEREGLSRAGESLARKLNPPESPVRGFIEPGKALAQALDSLRKSRDSLNGGFGTAPKFPLPGNILFLLSRCSPEDPGSEELAMAVCQLEAMRMGGIFDHLGYGFARYAVDRAWRIPHFEKMLGDNAMLALLYHEAGRITRRRDLGRVGEDILEYLRRDMRLSRGGYCASEDADSGGAEGLFYTWTPAEIASVLGTEEAEIFCRAFNVTENGNFEEGRSVLWRSRGPGVSGGIPALDPALQKALGKLLEERQKRERPLRDDSVITEWNGLLLGTLSRIGRDVPEFLEEARSLWEFGRTFFFRSDGRLLRLGWGDGNGSLACLDDYAALFWGVAELYATTGDCVFLESATRLSEEMNRLFCPSGQSGFDFLPVDGEPYPIRIRRAEEGGLPSGNGLAAYAMARLYRSTGNNAWKKSALSIYEAFSGEIARFPGAYATLLAGVAEIEAVEATPGKA